MATAEAPSRPPEDLVDATGALSPAPAVAEVAEVPVDASPAPEASQPTVEATLEPTIESSAETPTAGPDNPEIVKIRDRLVEQKNNRIQAHDAVKILYKIAATETFSDAEIATQLESVTAEYGVTAENIAETLEYFNLAEESFSEDFSPERKAEMICILAEPIAEGVYDAETGHALVYKVVMRGNGTGDHVADYSRLHPIFGVTDKYFDGVDGVKQRKDHIAKHEVGHGLDRYLGLNQNEEIQDQIGKMVGDVDNLRNRESHHSINAINQYIAVRDKDGATAAEIREMQSWLSEELLAEKTAAYLQSSDKLDGFLLAIWSVMPKENQTKLEQNPGLLAEWEKENSFLFTKIQAEMSDKKAMKKKILDATAASRDRINATSDEDLDSEDFFGEGFVGPGLSETKPEQQKKSEETFFQMMANSFKEIAESSREVTDVIPGTKAA